VNWHQLQIPEHLHRSDGASGQVVESQNSYRWISQKRFGKTHFNGRSEIAYPESSGWIVKAMDRLATTAGPNQRGLLDCARIRIQRVPAFTRLSGRRFGKAGVKSRVP